MINPQMKLFGSLAASSGATVIALALLASPGSMRSAPLHPNLVTEDTAIRTFRIAIPEATLMDLRQCVLATRWPDQETVGDPSQGAQLAKMQQLMHYWGTEYDWRKVEAKAQFLAAVCNQD